MINASRYSGLLIASFPAHRDDFKREEGIYLRSRVLAEIANACIATRDWKLLSKVYSLVEKVLTGDPDDDVLNAVHVSVIEHLNFGHPNGAAAMAMMPSSVRKACENLGGFSPIPAHGNPSDKNVRRHKKQTKRPRRTRSKIQ